MSHEILTHMPAQLRKYVVREMECETPGQFDLMNACKALDMGKSNNSAKVPLTNDALGALLEICRDWLDDRNFGKVTAAKSVLIRHELDYVPVDPRERRHEVKFPASLAHYLSGEKAQGESPEILADLERCTWSKTSTQGRVRYATLTWMLKNAEACSIHLSGAVQRSGKRFLTTYQPAWEETGRLIDKYEKAAAVADQVPAEVEHQDQAEVEVIEDQEPADNADQEAEGEAAPVQAGKSESGPAPANWVDLAESADTETARAWWARKVASWGR
ncbi:hypothetical protein [Kitasatospora sp. MBT66]|uniref:hypothetical protein n=1 Tax=Kitasatospora sp. MBT66 TaxID=1444769 RepID=UPI0005BBD097|nr:hypothetical protein [Kitasatospora sp. MBT66]